MRGLRNMDDGPARITDAEERKIVRRQARAIVVKGLAGTAAAAALLALLS
jgi:hypothetical protein